MPPSISPADLQFLLREADAAARRLRRKLRLSHDDVEDLRQELLLDLIVRFRSFDPARGSLGAFVGTVMRHQAGRIAARVNRERLLYGISLDEAIPGGEGICRGDLVAEDEGLAALHGQPTDSFAATDHRLDVERGVGILRDDDGGLCAALSHSTVDELAAVRGARSTLYRRVKEIRLVLTAAGLRAA